MSQDILNLIARKADVPHLAEYFGLWSILEDPFQSAVQRVSGMNLKVHVANYRPSLPTQPRETQSSYELSGDTAIIHLSGVLMKRLTSLSDGTSTILARRQVRHAAANERVKSIVLLIDSPGGTVSGTFDLADDVAAAAKKKPLVAYIQDTGASAAYAVASQAGKIYANKTALVGSIGTYGLVHDESKRAEKMGIIVHVLRAGKFKGAGEPGTEITEEQLGEWQKIVDQVNEPFLIAVARGRQLSLERVRQLADGRVHIGEAAVKLRLIDGIRTFDQVLSGLEKEIKGATPQQQQTTPARPAESLAGGNQGSSEPAHVVPTTTPPRTERKCPVTQQETDRAAIAAFNEAVAQKTKAGMTRRKAVENLVRRDPELHRNFLVATNRNRPGALAQL